MPVVPFIPLIASSVGGLIAGKKAQQSAQQRSPEEAAALTGAQTGAGALQSSGIEQMTTGAATQKPATSYFDTLLHGNRAAQSQAVAAPTAAVTDVYRGAERNLERSGVRGAAKDVASADLGRQRASQIAGLVTGVQPAAAQALTSIGQTQQAQGAGRVQGASSTYANLLGQGANNRQYARSEGEKAGTGIGGLIFDVASSAFGGKKPKNPWMPQADYNYEGGG